MVPGGTQVLPGGCRVVIAHIMNVLGSLGKVGFGPLTPRGGVWGGSSPHSRAYLAPWRQKGVSGDPPPPNSMAYLAPWCQPLAIIGLGYVAPLVAALVRRANAFDTSTQFIN